MNENDKILINAYFDSETSEDETRYIESLLQSNSEANEYANNIKEANNEINAYFNSPEIFDLKTNIDSFIEKQKLKLSNAKFNWGDFFYNPRYVGFAASAVFLAIILVPTFNENQSNNLPTYTISSERASSDVIDFNKILNNAVLEYGDKSIWAFKIKTDESILIVQVNDLKDDCYIGTISREKTSGIKEFKICKD